jgi:hydrogenase expression/formation protein HypD
MGYSQYELICNQYQVPIVVTGFEPLDILQGIYLCVQQLEKGKYKVENQYSRSVQKRGNQNAQNLMKEVFTTTDYYWRGIATIAQSGLKIREKYAHLDAELKFESKLSTQKVTECQDCISGEILQGIKKPHQCLAFGNKCTPEQPLGAPMVSSEGACAAYYRYRQLNRSCADSITPN